MHNIRLILMLYILFSGGLRLQAAEHPERGLLAFFDDTEKGYLGATSIELSIALAQKAGPILASTSVLKNVLSEYGKNIDDPSYGNLFKRFIAQTTPSKQNRKLLHLFQNLKKFQNYPQKKHYLQKWTAYKYILLKAVRFNPDQWIIKRVNEFLHLLIPITYLQNKGIDIQQVSQDNAQTISDTELTLGLRINHMQTTTIENILQTPEPAPQPHYVIQTLYDEASGTSNIFCVRSEYLNRSIAIPVWTVLIAGHGETRSEIASININDFKKLLYFLEHKILCKLLVYNTCYSGGINIQEVYKDTTRDLQDTYSFPIIMHALTDAAVFSAILDIELDSNDELQVVNSISFTAFLQAAAEPDITDYSNVIKHIFRLEPRVHPNEVPQIKMPGLEWFSALDTDQVVGIGHILASSRSADPPLDIATFFNKFPRILLLYTSDIPFTLELNPGLKAIVSMIPGMALHTLYGLSSETRSISGIINMFMKIHRANPVKLFFIKNIQGNEESAQDVLIICNINSQSNASTDDPYACIAYYLYDNHLFVKKNRQDIPQIATVQENQEYQNYVQKITGKPQYIQLATYHPSDDQTLPTLTFPGPFALSNQAIIETITAPTGTTIASIINTISLMHPKEAVTIIKEVVAVPPNETTPVLFNNVIVDSKYHRILFTLDGKFFSNKGELSHDYMPHYMKILTWKEPFPMQQGSLLPVSINPKQRKLIENAIKKRMLQESKKRKRVD